MTAFLGGAVVGLFIGVVVGMLMAAVCQLARESDEMTERTLQQEQEQERLQHWPRPALKVLR